MIFYGEENIQSRLCNLTYVFKGHVKFSKMYMVNFNVSILNGLKVLENLEKMKTLKIIFFLGQSFTIGLK